MRGAAAGAGPGEGHGADGRDGQDGDLAHGVEAPEVDEDHVHHVAAAAVGERPLDHLLARRSGRCGCPTAISAKANTIAPTPAGDGDADGGGRRRRAGPNRVGQAPEDQHEQHRRQRLDRDLGEGQVGRALR